MARKYSDVGVVIAAGGRGRRLGGNIPKQFRLLAGIPVLQRTIAAFESHRAVGEIVVVVPRGSLPRARRLVDRARFRKVSRIVPGGRERQDSVWAGLHAFHSVPGIVLVHDAVRPLVGARIIGDVIRRARDSKAAVVGVRVKDTVKLEGRMGFYTKTLPRKRLWTVQTPQGFHYRLLLRAHVSARRAGVKSTDEGSLVERLGIPVRIVEGNDRNIKITTRDDLKIADFLLKTSPRP